MTPGGGANDWPPATSGSDVAGRLAKGPDRHGPEDPLGKRGRARRASRGDRAGRAPAPGWQEARAAAGGEEPRPASGQGAECTGPDAASSRSAPAAPGAEKVAPPKTRDREGATARARCS